MDKSLYFFNIVFIVIQNYFLKIFVSFLFRKPKKEISSLLVYRAGGLGDFIFCLPAIEKLYALYNKNLYFMTYAPTDGEHYNKLKDKNINDLPWLNFLKPERFTEIFILRNLTLKNIKEFRRRLKKINLDGIILMTHSGEPFSSILKKLIILRFLGINKAKVVGWRQIYSYSLFRKYHIRWGFLDHKTIGPIRAVNDFFDIDSNFKDIPYPKIYNLNFCKKSVMSFKDAHKIDEYVVMCPGSIHSFKEWGLSNYFDLGKLILSQNDNIKILIAGPKSDSNIAEKLCFSKRVINICGKFSLSELSIIFNEAICVFSNDGGGSHLAAASEAKIISFANGGEEPGIVTPFGKYVTELRNYTDCTPCLNYTSCPLGHSKCVKDISVKRAFDKFKTISNHSFID